MADKHQNMPARLWIGPCTIDDDYFTKRLVNQCVYLGGPIQCQDPDPCLYRLQPTRNDLIGEKLASEMGQMLKINIECFEVPIEEFIDWLYRAQALSKYYASEEGIVDDPPDWLHNTHAALYKLCENILAPQHIEWCSP